MKKKFIKNIYKIIYFQLYSKQQLIQKFQSQISHASFSQMVTVSILRNDNAISRLIYVQRMVDDQIKIGPSFAVECPLIGLPEFESLYLNSTQFIFVKSSQFISELQNLNSHPIFKEIPEIDLNLKFRKFHNSEIILDFLN